MKLRDINLLDIGNTVQLAGAVYAGPGVVYLCLFPDELDTDMRASVRLDMDTEDWKTFLRQTDLLEVEVVDGNKKAIARKSQRQIDQQVSWNVFKRDSYACRYCGADNVPLTVDHLVRWEEAGPTIEDNLVAACRRCNKTRGATSFTAWLHSGDYAQLSQKLPRAVLMSNRELLTKLPLIPRVNKVRSR